MRMKKLISAFMAATIVAVAAFPSFATDVTSPGDLTVPVATDEGEESFTVTIPADISVAWGDYEKDYPINITVDGILKSENALTVSVSDGDDNAAEGKMFLNGFDLSYSVAYTVSNLDFEPYTGNFNQQVSAILKVNDKEFDNKPAGDYSATLTFTATIGSSVQ